MTEKKKTRAGRQLSGGLLNLENVPDGIMLFRLSPKDEREYVLLGNQLIKFVDENPGALRVVDFTTHYKIDKETFYRWVSRSEYLRSALTYAKDVFFKRREQAGLENKLNASIVLQTLPLYCDDLKALKKELASKQSDQQGDITVYVDSYPLANKDKKHDGDKS